MKAKTFRVVGVDDVLHKLTVQDAAVVTTTGRCRSRRQSGLPFNWAKLKDYFKQRWVLHDHYVQDSTVRVFWAGGVPVNVNEQASCDLSMKYRNLGR